MRMPPARGPSSAVLRALAEPGSGDIADPGLSGSRLSQRTGLGPLALYPLLDRFEDDGWIHGYWEQFPPDGQARRRFYRLTDAGLRAAEAARSAATVRSGGFARCLSRLQAVRSAVARLAARPAVTAAAIITAVACVLIQLSHTHLSAAAVGAAAGALMPVCMPVLAPLVAGGRTRGARSAAPDTARRPRPAAVATVANAASLALDRLSAVEIRLARTLARLASLVVGSRCAVLGEAWTADLADAASGSRRVPLRGLRHSAGCLFASVRIRLLRRRCGSLDRRLDLLMAPRRRAGAGLGALLYLPTTGFRHRGMDGAIVVTVQLALIAVLLWAIFHAARALRGSRVAAHDH